MIYLIFFTAFGCGILFGAYLGKVWAQDADFTQAYELGFQDGCETGYDKGKRDSL